MEIKEIVSFYINEDAKTVEVEFRLISDLDTQIRIDDFSLDILEDYGYNIYSDSYDIFEEVSYEYSDEDTTDLDEPRTTYDIQEEDLISFLSEYYLSNRKRLPKTEIF
jgi:hypothetical protein